METASLPSECGSAGRVHPRRSGGDDRRAGGLAGLPRHPADRGPARFVPARRLPRVVEARQRAQRHRAGQRRLHLRGVAGASLPALRAGGRGADPGRLPDHGVGRHGRREPLDLPLFRVGSRPVSRCRSRRLGLRARQPRHSHHHPAQLREPLQLRVRPLAGAAADFGRHFPPGEPRHRHRRERPHGALSGAYRRVVEPSEHHPCSRCVHPLVERAVRKPDG